MANNNPTTNDSPTERKTLSAQIDRLDTILDGLADALNESVAEAVKGVVGQVVREAVEAAVREVLDSPAVLRAALARHEPVVSDEEPHEAESPVESAEEPEPTTWGWLCRQASETWAKAVGALRQAGVWATERLSVALSLAVVVTLTVWQFRKTGSVAVGAGLLSAAAGFFAGPALAAAMCGVGGAVLALAAMVLVPLARLLLTGEVGLVDDA